MPVADLVLEGSGSRGIALAGALTVLEESGYQFRKVAGTSAGALVGALIAAGYSAAETAYILRSWDYNTYQDAQSSFVSSPRAAQMSEIMEKGLFSGSYLTDAISEALMAKAVLTFGDLKLSDTHTLTDPSASAPYRFVAQVSDITLGAVRHLPWDYAEYGLDPDAMSVASAVCASMALPFFYQPVKIVTANGTSWLVDGGLMSDFPVGIFDRPDGLPPRWPTFGVRISAPSGTATNPSNGDDAVSVMRAMLETLANVNDRITYTSPAILARTIFVDAMQVSAIDFSLSVTQKQALYDSGRRAAEVFLDHWRSEAFRDQPGESGDPDSRAGKAQRRVQAEADRVLRGINPSINLVYGWPE